MEAYGEWARRYEDDLGGDYGYVAPALMARMLLGTGLAATEEILDAGCGTGLVGRELANAGCQRIDGLDYSEAMLAEARKKGVYRSLLQADLNATLPLPDGSYGAVICVGTFTTGHVGPAALDELVRVARSGAPICFTVRQDFWVASSFADQVEALTAAGRWRPVRVEDVDYIQHEQAQCIGALFEVA